MLSFAKKTHTKTLVYIPDMTHTCVFYFPRRAQELLFKLEDKNCELASAIAYGRSIPPLGKKEKSKTEMTANVQENKSEHTRG